MAIVIPHRFIERLMPNQAMNQIRVLIIGTFNPGEPADTALTPEHRQILQSIFDTRKYQRFKEVKNFTSITLLILGIPINWKN